MKNARHINEVPDQAHFPVLVEDSYVKDDGYNGYDNVQILHYMPFTSVIELEQWIIANNGMKTFKVINVKAVEFELKTTITVKD